MADDVNEAIEAALITISSSVERSGNMKKELKHTIYETVSTLRKLFVQLIDVSESRNKKISKLEMLANNKGGAGRGRQQ
jgi:predicted nucleic acid-binding OB-fold protein